MKSSNITNYIQDMSYLVSHPFHPKSEILFRPFEQICIRSNEKQDRRDDADHAGRRVRWKVLENCLKNVRIVLNQHYIFGHVVFTELWSYSLFDPYDGNAWIRTAVGSHKAAPRSASVERDEQKESYPWKINFIIDGHKTVAFIFSDCQ